MDVHAIHCPSCGEPLDVAIDWSVNRQEYVEDCQVCCRPMVLQITIDAERNADITVRVETD
ncbi:MAG TPA: CPXCG motif-containing cysteine-rich protein [Acidobacteria bacterium]|nr:CPXCG motif-containing cysteine-rich protein [Acidobacteriota bacterium]HIM14606.1 CPXCG motif-containing cysteine-rich protein [Acidobacteriota bacterium]